MGKRPAEAWKDRCVNVGSVTGFRRLPLKIGVRVQWYNFRPYVPRTFNSKIADLPHLRHASKRKRHKVPGLWHRNHCESRDKIEKS